VEDLREMVAELRRLHAQLSPFGRADGLANDMVEAIEYWCFLAQSAVDLDKRLNYPRLAQNESLWMTELEAARARKQSPQDKEYREVLQIGARLFELLKAVPLPPNGYLGVLRIIREHFGFLERDYGFKVVDEQPIKIVFHSDSVFVHAGYAKTASSSFSLGLIRDQHSFWIEDLLYLHGDERYRTIPYYIELKTEDDVETWFGFIAEILRTYGDKLLRGDNDAFLQLAAAQQKRDEEYGREMDRLHGISSSDE